MKGNRNYYIWVIVVSCFLFEAAALGLGTATSNLYVKPICDDMQFSRSQFSLVFSIISILNMATSLSFGFVHRKIGVRVIFLIGALCEASAFLVYYFAQSILHFYFGAFLMGIGLMYLGAIPLSIVISNWFVEKRGLILGVVFSGSGIGGMILNPLIGHWILTAGWREAYLHSALIVAVVSIPALIFIREKPEDINLRPYGCRTGTHMISPTGKKGISWKEAVWHSRLWLTLLAVMMFGMSIQGMFLSTSAYLNDIGIDAQFISFVMSFIFFSNLGGKLLLGLVNDRYGIRRVMVATNIAFLAAAVLLLFTKNMLMTTTFAFFFGIAGVALTTPLSIITSNLFGDKDYSTLFGIVMAAFTIGVSIGTPLNGLSFDLFGTYHPAFIVDIALEVVAACIIITVLRRSESNVIMTKEAVPIDMGLPL